MIYYTHSSLHNIGSTISKSLDKKLIKSLQNKHDGFRLSLYLLNNVKFKLPFVNNSFLPNWAGQKSIKGSTFPFIFMQKKSKTRERFLIFSVLMLSALVIELRWYAEVLDFSSQNWKIYPTISAECRIQN